jgi:hypothetical protein
MKDIESIVLSAFLGLVNIMYLVQCACSGCLLLHLLAHIGINARNRTHCCVFVLHQVGIYGGFDAFNHNIGV